MSRSLMISSLLLLSPFAMAADSDFDWEASAFYADSDNADSFGLNGRYFFNTVDTTRGPLAEATFLDRTTNVGFAYSHTDIDFSNLTSSNTNNYSLNGTYALGEQDLYFIASYNHNDTDFGTFNSYSFGVGHYLDDDWDVSAAVVIDDDEDFAALGFSTNKLFDLGGDTYFKLGGGLSFNEQGDDSFNIDSAYYFNRYTSVNLNYAWSGDALGLDDGLANIGVTWFYTPTISISANTSVGLGDVDIDAFDTFALVAQARF